MNKNFYEETIDIKTLNQYTAVNTSRKKKKNIYPEPSFIKLSRRKEKERNKK